MQLQILELGLRPFSATSATVCNLWSTYHKAWRIPKENSLSSQIWTIINHWLYRLGNWFERNPIPIQWDNDNSIKRLALGMWIHKIFYIILAAGDLCPYLWHVKMVYRKSFGYFFLSANWENTSTGQSHSSSVQSLIDCSGLHSWKKTIP